MDVVDKQTRSRMMAGIGSKDTKPELAVRRYLHRSGFRFRLHVTKLPGKPDLVLSKYRAVIFVQGCFWHRHSNCRYGTTPSSNVKKWTEKFAANMARDARNIAALRDAGWRVFLIWECGLRRKPVEKALEWLPGALLNRKRYFVNWPCATRGKT
jgi:DNA mismatch endonuclease (patch repair protein)